jgi:glycosyltransferase involved in cell wall biosynthesis
LGKDGKFMPGDLRVLHIVGGNLSGGAARGALYLSESLREIGVDSRIVCSDPALEAGSLHNTSVADGPLGRLSSLARSKAESWPMQLFSSRDGRLFSLGMSGIRWASRPDVRECDIVHLHWINRGMLSIDGIGELGKPCVWTMRDMWPFTGGCHYAMQCDGYLRQCGQCPALGSTRNKDVSSWVHRRKREKLPADITYVGISDWISDAARASSLLAGRDIRTVANSIDTQSFYPVPKRLAREQLGLPVDRPILLHGSLSANDSYKGQALLEDAKKQLAIPGLLTCSFGLGGQSGSAPVDRHFGLIRDDATLRTVYAAADVLAFPSIQEAFGKVPAEAMACGTPAVVFTGTGPGEIVTHKVTGYAARHGDTRDLAAGIAWVLADAGRLDEMSGSAAADAALRFDPKVAARHYLEIYREKLGGGAS